MNRPILVSRDDEGCSRQRKWDVEAKRCERKCELDGGIGRKDVCVVCMCKGEEMAGHRSQAQMLLESRQVT